MKNTLLTGFCLFLLLLNSSLALVYADENKAVKQPNIVLILTDDQPYGYLGVTGNTLVETPNIDALANKGVLFTNTHVSSAICTPSRVSLLLGQYERKHGVNFNSGTAVSAKAWQQAYPELFKQSGYYTGWIGKNHAPVGKRGYQTGLMEKSFDYWYAGHGHISFYPKERHSIFKEAVSDTQVEVIEEGVNDFLNTNEYKFKKALTFFDKRPKDKPFMLSINFNLPHGAGTNTMQMRASDNERYKSKYRDKPIPLPKQYVAKNDIKQPKLPKELLKVGDRQTIYDYVDTPERLKEQYVRQLQAMTGIDNLVGNLMNELEQQGVADNTVIVFTSDHGLFMGEFGLGGKALCYEKTTHVPLIIYDPRHQQRDGRNNALVQTIDLAPTMLSLAGIPIPNSMQGEDISPVFYHKKSTQREYAYSENLWSTHFGNPRCEAVQNNEWKYIRYYKNDNLSAQKKIQLAKQLSIPTGKMLYGVHDNDIAQYRHFIESSINGEQAVYEELYHLAADPDETTNLANNAQHQTKLKQLRTAWYKKLTQAKGKGDPKLVRYTLDAQLAFGKKVKLE